MADNNQDLSITLRGETSNFTSAINKAKKDFKDAMDAIATESKRAKTDLDSAFGALNIRTGDQILAEGAKIQSAFNLIRVSADASANDVARAAEAMKAKFADLSAELKGTTPHLNSLGEAFTGMGAKIAASIAAVAGFTAAMSQVKQVFSESNTYEQTVNVLANVTGSMDKAKASYDKLAETSNRLGLSQKDLTNQYATFMASAKGSVLEGEKADRIFNSLATTFAALHLPTEKVNEALLAVSQMMSKGKIESQELRLQLGNAFPGAMNLFAESMGKSTAELDKMMQSTGIAIENLGPFAAKMEETVGAGAARNLDTITGKWNIYQNGLKQLFITIGESGAMEALKTVLDELNDRFKKMAEDGSLKQMAINIAEAISTVIYSLKAMYDFINNNIGKIAALAAAFAVFKTGSFLVGIIGELNTMVVAIEAANGAAIGLVARVGAVGAAAFIGWEIGTAINDFIIEPFMKAKDKADILRDAAHQMADELAKIKPIDMGKVFGNIDADTASRMQFVTESYSKAMDAAIKADNAAAERFKSNIDKRVADDEAKNKALIAQANSLETQLTALAQQKAQLEIQLRNESEANKKSEIQSALNDNIYKNNQLLAADKALAKDRADAAAIASQNITKFEALQAKERVKEQTIIDSAAKANFTKAESERQAALRAASKTEQEISKERTNAISNQESVLKIALEKLKQQQLQQDRDLVAASIPIFDHRRAELQALEDKITEYAKKGADARAQIYAEGERKKLEALQEATTRQINEITSKGDAQVEIYKRNYEAIKSQGASWYESTKTFNARVEFAHNEHLMAFGAIVNRVIEEAKRRRDSLADILKQEEADVAANKKKIQDLNDQEAKRGNAWEEDAFQAAQKRRTEGEQYLKLQERMMNQAKEAAEINKAIEDQKGVATDAQKERLKELESQFRSENKEADNFGKTTKDAVISADQALKDFTKNQELGLKTFNQSAENQKKGFEALNEQLTKVGGTMDITKKAIAELDKVMGEMTSKHRELKFDTNTEELSKKVHELAELAKKPLDLSVTVNDAPAKEQITEIVKPSDKPILPKVDDASVTAYNGVITNLTAPKIQYIDIVTRGGSSSGGDSGGISMFADGGLIQGAGTGTSDSIPALVSNGEYVIKASSVQRFGSNFFNALNSGFLPAMASNTPRFAEGGLVGGSSSRNDTVNINIALGGKSYAVQGAREQAMGLASALQALSRAA